MDAFVHRLQYKPVDQVSQPIFYFLFGCYFCYQQVVVRIITRYVMPGTRYLISHCLENVRAVYVTRILI